MGHSLENGLVIKNDDIGNAHIKYIVLGLIDDFTRSFKNQNSVIKIYGPFGRP